MIYVLYALPVLAVVFTWFAIEFRACQQHWETWNWVEKIYNKYPFLQKVKW